MNKLTVENIETFADRYYAAHPDDRKAIRVDFEAAILGLMQDRDRLSQAIDEIRAEIPKGSYAGSFYYATKSILERLEADAH